jgi:hypothetical protein
VEVVQKWCWTFLGLKYALGEATAQKSLALSIAAVEDCARTNERRRRHNKTRRADETDPFEMCDDFGIDLVDGHQFVSGQR